MIVKHVKPIKVIVLLLYITLWLFNIAMENGPFTDDLPIKTSICSEESLLSTRLGFPTLFL